MLPEKARLCRIRHRGHLSAVAARSRSHPSPDAAPVAGWNCAVVSLIVMCEFSVDRRDRVASFAGALSIDAVSCGRHDSPGN